MNYFFSDQQRFQTERDGEGEKKVRTLCCVVLCEINAENWVKVVNEMFTTEYKFGGKNCFNVMIVFVCKLFNPLEPRRF